MSYCKIGELFDILKYTGPFQESLARYYFRQLVEAVAYCHEKRIAHRNLKLDNIMFDENYVLKLKGFEFAAPIQESEMLSSQLGTPGYMAPEMHLGKKYSGPKVDIFAMGVILFQLLNKNPPFGAAKPDDLYYVILV